MPKDDARFIAEKLNDHDAITRAIQKGVREAVLAHAHAGRPVATCRDGKVVWVSPEEILRTLGAQGGPS